MLDSVINKARNTALDDYFSSREKAAKYRDSHGETSLMARYWDIRAKKAAAHLEAIEKLLKGGE